MNRIPFFIFGEIFMRSIKKAKYNSSHILYKKIRRYQMNWKIINFVIMKFEKKYGEKDKLFYYCAKEGFTEWTHGKF